MDGGKGKSSEPLVWVVEDQEQEQQYQLANPSTRKRKRMEFLGWASRPLIHFLESIGKNTDRPISQFDVTAIVNEYVDQNLLEPETAFYQQYILGTMKSKPMKKKKKRVVCDERLRTLFGRRSISRVMIYKLLERHLAEANGLFDSDESNDCLSEDEEERDGKNKRSYRPKRLVVEMSNPESFFAAVIPENIKLVYLRRSLVQEILKQDNGEMKIVGSFVRIKSDPNDCLQKHSHHLLQVTGLKRDSVNVDGDSKILLHAYGMIKDIPIGLLSDENFAEEECDDLRQRMKSGMLKRLTVVELQQKAHILHKDITKHWLARELALLQNLIDRANEKGWRRELFEYLERKELLQTQEEQSRLFTELPKILAEELEPEATTVRHFDEVEQGNDSQPESTVKGLTEAPFSDYSDDDFESTWAVDGYSSEDHEPDGSVQEHDKKPENPTNERNEANETQTLNEVKPEPPRAPVEPEVIDLSDDEENELPTQEVSASAEMWNYLDPLGKVQGPFAMASLKRWSEADYFPPDFRIWKTGQTPNEAVYLKELLVWFFPISGRPLL